jgi:endogenous inhibitor of DNA gyrase (YacG/DUF329 family)
MPGPTCPICGADVEAPTDRPDSLEENVECPACGQPLAWFHEDRVGGKWIRDEGAAGRRRMGEGPGEIDSPAVT